MATIKQDVKQNLRESMEQNTGIVGQVLKDRREKQQHDKQVAAELSEINIKTSRLKNDGRAFKKIEVSTIQISENFQLINKWADAQVTTHEETHLALKQQQEEAAAVAQKQAQPTITIPDPKEDESIFDNILDLFGKMGKKIKTKFPKGPKGRAGRAPKGKLDALKQIGKEAFKFGAKNIGSIAKAGIGIGAATYSEGLNTNEQEELEKRRNLPPTITQKPVDYSVPPPTGAVEANAKTAAQAPALETAKTTLTQPLPPPLPSAPAAPPPAAVSPPPPTTTTVSQGGGRSGTAPAAITPAPSISASLTPAATPLTIGKQEATPTSVPALTSIVKTADPGVSLDGMQATFEKAVATMAVSFKKETGKTLLATSGVRTNEKQKELFDAKVASLGGNEAAAKKLVAEPMPPLGQGKGSMHLKGLAIDINSKGDSGINTLAGSRDAPTGWLEKFGLTRPVPKEDWHIQLSGTPPAGDVGGVPGKDGNPIDPSTGKHMAIPVDPNSGAKLLDSSKTVEQLKKEQNARGTQTVVMTETTNVTEYEKKKKPQGQTAAAVG